MEAKNVLAIVAVAMLALIIGQVQADSVTVPNHSFELIYKPGSTTITADIPDGTWTNGVGTDCMLEGGGSTANYSDGTSGGLVDVLGWINSPARPTAYEWDKGSGTVSKQGSVPLDGGDYTFGANGRNWGVPDSGAVESDAALIYNVDGTYRITMLINGPIFPVTLDLLAGDVVITPTSLVTPPAPNAWDEVSRTYDMATLVGHVGEPLRIRAGWGTNTGTEDGQTQSHLDLVTLEVFDRIFPSPDYGEVPLVDAAMELSWTNLPTPDSNDVTYVDVLFGTEPNELDPAYDMALIVDTENVESVVVDASVPDTYYWQVTSYINGADNINDANAIESFLLQFRSTDDFAPTVEIVTLDQMTWSGGDVPIDATTTDDDVSALTIEWTADAASLADPNLTIEILNGDTADPTVKITKAVPTGDVVTVTMTVTVGDASTPEADSASIEIDVYDDACIMARLAEGKSAITDFNGNCITGLEDLALIVEAWLDSYAVTGPVDRP